MTPTEVLAELVEGRSLARDDCRNAVLEILDGKWSEVETASFLTALRTRGETTEELVGGVLALRDRVVAPPARIPDVLDTCGTGGDGAHTFNISTAAAFAVAACGLPVAKHGNRGFSSSSGSADVLQALGVNINADHRIVFDLLREVGLGFFFAPSWRPSMKAVGQVRRQLRFRTLFNLLGPLCNPLGADFQLLGVGRPEWVDRLAGALVELRAPAATLVIGADGLDEVTLTGPTRVVAIRLGQMSQLEWRPADFGLPIHDGSAWRVDSPIESAALVRSALAGEPGPALDIVLANAAAALWTARRVEDLRAGVDHARQAIADGKALAILETMARRTQAGGAT